MRLLHIIDGLDSIGGAEKMLISYVNKMPEQHHIVVVLKGESSLPFNENISIQFFQIGFTGYLSIFKSVHRLKQIIKKFKPTVIHAHLPLATFIARLSYPRNINFFFSIHNNYSDSLKKTSWFLFLMEKMLSSSNEIGVFVSDAARKDYEDIINFTGATHVLHNFINDDFFEKPFANPFSSSMDVKMIAVGNIKHQKNYEFLIECLNEIDLPFTLDIFGRGEMKINSTKVTIKGWCSNIQNVLPKYDIFISSSYYEGFGIAPLEASAKGLPVLLSDITVFREVTKNKALFFNPRKKEELKHLLISIYNDKTALVNKSMELNRYVNKEYRIKQYISKLFAIYESAK